MRNLVPFMPLVLALTASPALAEDVVSGVVGADSQQVFSDLYVQNPDPTVKASASLDGSIIGIDDCSADAFVSHGVTNQIAKGLGEELDFGPSCRFDLAKGVQVELSAFRYFLGGQPDLTFLEGKVTVGPVDASMAQYVVDGNAPDATKVEVGYSVEPTKSLSFRALLVYEHGFGLPDILVGGVEGSLALGGAWSLTGAFYTPLHQTRGDPRKSQAVVGVLRSFSF